MGPPAGAPRRGPAPSPPPSPAAAAAGSSAAPARERERGWGRRAAAAHGAVSTRGQENFGTQLLQGNSCCRAGCCYRLLPCQSTAAPVARTASDAFGTRWGGGARGRPEHQRTSGGRGRCSRPGGGGESLPPSWNALQAGMGGGGGGGGRENVARTSAASSGFMMYENHVVAPGTQSQDTSSYKTARVVCLA